MFCLLVHQTNRIPIEIEKCARVQGKCARVRGRVIDTAKKSLIEGVNRLSLHQGGGGSGQSVNSGKLCIKY